MTLDLLVYQISKTGQARTDQGRPGHTMTDQERQGQTKSDMVRPGQTRAYQDKTRHTRNTWNTLIFWKSWNTRNTCFYLCLPTWEKFPHFPVFFLVEDVPQQCCQYFLLWWYLQKITPDFWRYLHAKLIYLRETSLQASAEGLPRSKFSSACCAQTSEPG